MRDLGRSFAELQEIVTPYREYRQVLTQAAEARQMEAAESEPEMAAFFRDEAVRAEARAEELRGALELLLIPKDPNDGKNVIAEIRAGTGGAGGGPVGGGAPRHVSALRGTASLEDGDPLDVGVGGRRPQGGRDGGARQGCVHAAEARIRRPSRSARAGDRIPGPAAHLDGDRGRAAGGRGGGRRDPPRGPADRRLPVVRTGRPVGEHHRLRGADHPQAHRHQGRVPGGALPAPEQGEGDALPAGPAAATRAGRGPGEGGRQPPLAGRHRASEPRRSAPTTSPTVA